MKLKGRTLISSNIVGDRCSLYLELSKWDSAYG